MPQVWIDRILLTTIVVVVAIVLRLILGAVIRRVVQALIAKGAPSDAADLGARARRILAKASGLGIERHRQRVRTLGDLLRNVVDIVIWTVTLLTVLAIVGVPMTPLLASAGVGGIAIGFGAQSLVKDYISGIFMLAEDQFGVGDLVQVGDVKGTVLEVSLRVTKLRDGTGTVWYIRNGEILNVGNVSQGHSTAFVEVPVAIDEDPAHVAMVLRDAVAGMHEDPKWADVLLEDPTVLGVDSMSGGTMTLKIMLKTGPDKHWAAMRDVRARAQRACAEAGIRGPILVAPPASPPK